ncbi:amino acid permease [Streptomyces mobaraensis NBRC 13819 = DSM 40847]|uniref:Putative amino acid permease n=1 Tax=Streptomyces mobaraensis (strain ATCC 29032 / DSM 40847 / JCM 4168 / NBRC 13819 / NCIMB 11159 / IPCR 16-22) TaxID=1223523 RepID=M3A4G3_STRM1|nr:amino acid permease [Streptomyces mobaraensis]EME99948.1 putative amino acid permease [Streptomyces mobaraensis NBRC 13819 = DSM 40847]QTT77497.1 amino acid permease [Streptomyces mobaraensis NBRC 13819 = DSM 40847]
MSRTLTPSPPPSGGGPATDAPPVGGAALDDRATAAPSEPNPSGSLSNGLKQRHLSMIALGGVIGAGLFVGSGAGIAAAGPSIVLAYAVSGLLVMFVMRMLGEMSAANPASGSFSVHADRAIGPWAGFTAGWMFWTLLVVGVAIEAIGAAHILQGWFPGTPSWMWVLILMALFCGSNLGSVAHFGEFEFWFAALKIGAIALFLGLGVLAILGVLPGSDSPGTAHLLHDGGFLPTGTNGLLIGLLASVAAYGGLETVTIAAAESENPVGGVAKAVRTTMWRIGVVYVGSMLVIVTLLPWHDKAVTEQGPYAAVLDRLGVPGGGQIMNVVVLIALLSAMNANIYGSSRMAYSLVARGQGPRFLAKVSGGIPRRAVLASSGFGFFAVLLSFWWPTTVFAWLLNMVGGVVLVVWGFIAVSQLLLRRRLEREAPGRLVVRMWGFPYLTWVTLAGVAGVLVLMTLDADTRVQLYFTGGLALALALVGRLRQRAGSR